MPHPHGPTCTCPPLPHDAGLLAYTVDCIHHVQLEQALDKIVRLRVLTTDPKPPANLVALPSEPRACDGTMTCICADCTKDRGRRVRQGVRPSQPIPIKQRRAA